MVQKTMYPAKIWSPETTLADPINQFVTTVTVVDSSVLPPAPNIMTIRAEYVDGDVDLTPETVYYPTDAVAGVFSGVTREFNGTAKSFLAGAKVSRIATAYDHDTFKDNIEDLVTAKAAAVHTHTESDVTNLVSDLAGKAATSHEHAGADITSGSIDGDRLPAISTTKKGAVPATGTPSDKFLKDDGTWSALPAGGDVVGPAGATADDIALFDGATGKLIKDSTKKIADLAAAVHEHAGADITSGSLDGDRLAAPTSTKRGGVKATGTPSGKFLKDDDTWAEVIIGDSGGVDNAILRADGAGGKSIQPSLVTIDDTGSVNIPAGQNYRVNGFDLPPANIGPDSTEATTWDINTTLTNTLNRIRHQIITITGEAWDTVSHSLTDIWAKFHGTTGHKHTAATGDGPQLDHGLLGGLTDDDHPQYFLADCSRPLSVNGCIKSVNNDSYIAIDGGVNSSGSGGHMTVTGKTYTLKPGACIWFVSNAAGTGWTEFMNAIGMTATPFLNMLSHKISNLLDPTEAQDAATKNYVDNAITVGISMGLQCTPAYFNATNANLIPALAGHKIVVHSIIANCSATSNIVIAGTIGGSTVNIFYLGPGAAFAASSTPDVVCDTNTAVSITTTAGYGVVTYYYIDA